MYLVRLSSILIVTLRLTLKFRILTTHVPMSGFVVITQVLFRTVMRLILFANLVVIMQCLMLGFVILKFKFLMNVRDLSYTILVRSRRRSVVALVV